MWKLYFLLIVSLLFSARSGSAQAPDASRLNGQWQGPLKVPGGALSLSITIVPLSNGTYYGALDVPQQRIARMPVEVTLKDDNITFGIEQAGSRFVGKVLAGGTRLEGTWQQPGLSAPLVLEKSAAPAAAQAARQMRLTPPYRESEVTFFNAAGKFKLAGTLTVPAGEGPFPAVVLLSDSGPQDRDADLQGYHLFGILADYLTRRGVAVLRFDDRGVGKSGGDYQRTTTADLVTDAQAAMGFLRSHSLVATNQIGLLGHGEGANVALLAAADPSTEPAFVVSLAGYGQPGREVLRRQQGEIMRLIGADGSQVKAAQQLYDRIIDAVRQTPSQPAARTKVIALLRSSNTALDEPMARARAAQITSPWSRFFIDFDPATRLAAVRCPVLLLTGAADLQVAASRDMGVLQKGLRQTTYGVEAHKLAGVNHWFQGDPAQWPIVAGERQAAFSPEGLEYLRTWLQAHTKSARAPLPVTVRRPPAAPTKAKPSLAAKRRSLAPRPTKSS
ncbi:MAG: alpha/beta hydrolase [Janthinobacterium lividum]